MREVIEHPKSCIRVAYIVSHPIQYQAPLLRRISLEPGIDLTVLFASDFSVRGYHDQGFGVEVKWDVPLLDGYKHDFLPSLRGLNYGLWSRLRSSDGISRYDVIWVHGYSSFATFQAMLIAKLLKIPVLLRAEPWLKDRVRGIAKRVLKAAAMKLLKNLVSAVLPIGTLNHQYWKHYFGDHFPAYLMPYAVDNLYFQIRCQAAAHQREQFRSSLGIPPGRPIILFASKLEARKHCDDLLGAYQLLLSRCGRSSPPYLIIVGDGQEKSTLEGCVARMGLDSVLFTGFQNQSELPRFLDLASVFVLPSRHEPWGLAVNEAMNAGTTVIVSNEVGCNVDLITHGVEGYVYPVRDTEALAGVLALALDNPTHTEVLGRNALHRVSNWSFEEDVAGLLQALHCVLRIGSEISARTP